VSKLRINGAIPPLPLYAFNNSQASHKSKTSYGVSTKYIINTGAIILLKITVMGLWARHMA
jgi:hypothetical protein